MKRNLYGTSKIKYEDKEETLKYYILDNEITLDNQVSKVYGLEIVKENNLNTENSLVSDLTTNKEFAEDIIKKLMDNTVTPMHLYDVLENLI